MGKSTYKNGPKGKWKQAVIVSASVLLASGMYWQISHKSNPNNQIVPSYRALRVIDGDTFETDEKQLIRLSGVDAPEIGNCGGQEAKLALEKQILNQNLYLKIIYRDQFHRLTAHVYNQDSLVAINLAKQGVVYYTGNGLKDDNLKLATEQAKANKTGIFSNKCTQTINQNNPKCVIKANSNLESTSRLYRFPGCGQYNSTIVQLYMGDQWFCTESEAVKAGFTKGKDCYQQSWTK